MTEQPTTRVRIAVCVDVDGYYCAAGHRDRFEGPYTAESDRTFAEDNLDGRDIDAARHVVWVEADVPLPARVESVVEGEVRGA